MLQTPVELKVGDSELAIPDHIKTVTGFALIGLRERVYHLVRISLEEYGQRRGGGTGALMRGLPIYYTIEHRKIRIWPASAHEWRAVIEDEPITMEDIGA